MSRLTGGHFSKTNLVRALLLHPEKKAFFTAAEKPPQ